MTPYLCRPEVQDVARCRVLPYGRAGTAGQGIATPAPRRHYADWAPVTASSRAIAFLTRCTVLLPAPTSFAVFRIPLPCASVSRMRCSISADIAGQPIGLPLLVLPVALTRSMPA